jgi:DNA repair protein RadC
MSATTRHHRLYSGDQPREKLQRKGTAALSDFELLEIVIGKNGAQAEANYVARQIQKMLHKGTGTLTYQSLQTIRGVGPALASEILAMMEVTRRYTVREATPLNRLQDVLARLDSIRYKRQEHLCCLSLDGAHRLIAQRTVTIGTLDMVVAHPREIFADPLADRAASIVLAHNHPSGEVQPSVKDIRLTQQLVAAGQLLGVPLQDHLIVAKNKHFSFRQHHMF